MNINLWQQTFPVPVGDSLVMALYKASAPSVLIASYQLPGPYTGQTQLYTFSGLQNVVYNYILYESPDGGADGTQLNSFSVQPNVNSYNTRDPLSLVANTSAYFASGTNFYGPDPSLVGWDFYPDIPGGIGILQYGVDYVKTVNGTPTTQDDLTANGYEYLATGYSIGDGEKSVLVFIPQLAATSTEISGTFISGTTRLTSNTTLTNSAAGQAFLLQGSAPALTITLPNLTTMAANEPIFFNSAGGSHINVALQPAAGQYFEWYGNQSNVALDQRSQPLWLGQCESVCIYQFTYPGVICWQVLFGGEGSRMVGEILYDYSLIPLNTVPCDGRILSRTTYARLWNWVQASGTTIIADSAFSNTTTYNGVAYTVNQGYFTSGDGSTTFRVPLLYKYGYLRIKSGSSGAGTGYGFAGDFNPQAVGAHDAATHGAGAIVGAGLNWFLSIINGRYSAGGGSDKFGGMSGTPDVNMRTSTNSNQNAFGENLTSTTGIYALIRI